MNLVRLMFSALGDSSQEQIKETRLGETGLGVSFDEETSPEPGTVMKADRTKVLVPQEVEPTWLRIDDSYKEIRGPVIVLDNAVEPGSSDKKCLNGIPVQDTLWTGIYGQVHLRHAPEGRYYCVDPKKLKVDTQNGTLDLKDSNQLLHSRLLYVEGPEKVDFNIARGNPFNGYHSVFYQGKVLEQTKDGQFIRTTVQITSSENPYDPLIGQVFEDKQHIMTGGGLEL